MEDAEKLILSKKHQADPPKESMSIKDGPQIIPFEAEPQVDSQEINEPSDGADQQLTRPDDQYQLDEIKDKSESETNLLRKNIQLCSGLDPVVPCVHDLSAKTDLSTKDTKKPGTRRNNPSRVPATSK